MRKRIGALFLALTMCLGLALPAMAALVPEDSGTAYPSEVTVDLDGTPTLFRMYALHEKDGNGTTNYIRLRDLAAVLDGTAAQFNVKWDGSILLERGKPYTDRNGTENNIPYSGDQPYRKNTAAIKVDGKAVDLAAFTLNKGSSTYFQLRELGSALGFVADWTAERGIFVETGGTGAEAQASDTALLKRLMEPVTLGAFLAAAEPIVVKEAPAKLEQWKREATSMKEPHETLHIPEITDQLTLFYKTTAKDVKYIDVGAAGTYDKSIITDELLSKPSKLPEVTQNKLPESWKGMGFSTNKAFAKEYRPYQKAEVQFTAENGFNYIRLYLDFATFRFPDYPSDPRQVNENELRELDRLLSWCMEYDVHLLITMNNYLDASGNSCTTGDGNPNANGSLNATTSWPLTQAYWEMLARRYAGIPGKYLSFEICNEGEPQGIDMNKAADNVGKIAKAIWAADPDRVCSYSGGATVSTKWFEKLAQQGLALSAHSYYPIFTSLVGLDYRERNAIAEPVWPQPYFPIGRVSKGQSELVIRGDLGGSELTLHVQKSGGRASLELKADGKTVETFTLKEPGNGEVIYGPNDLYKATIPAGVQELQLRVHDGYAKIDTVKLEKDGVKTVMVPTDMEGPDDDREPLPLVVNGDGTFTNSEKRYVDAEEIYNLSIKPYHDIAKKYNVGFMVNEFGMAGTNVEWDISTVTAFHETYLAMLEKYHLPWSYAELANRFPKHLVVLYGDHFQWANSTARTTEVGGTTIRYCPELLEVFRKYTKK